MEKVDFKKELKHLYKPPTKKVEIVMRKSYKFSDEKKKCCKAEKITCVRAAVTTARK